MSSKKRAAAAAVKVILMDTQYVETDPMSFRSVVQKLTGKDSSVAWIQENNSSSAEEEANRSGVTVSVEVDGQLQDDVVLSKGMSMSFKDLDRLILEVPPPEEWQWLCTQLMH